MIRSRMKALWAPRDNADRRDAMEQFDKELGALVREKRNAAGMTQPDVAEKLKISTEQISRYETGAVSIDVATLRGLAHVVGFSIADMFDQYERGEEPMSPDAISVAKLFDCLDDETKTTMKQFVGLIRTLERRYKDRSVKRQAGNGNTVAAEQD